MSRRRRDRGDSPDDLLGALSDQTTPPQTLNDFANAAYGAPAESFGLGRRGAYRARPLAIDDIYPDPAQPRRVIPAALRQYWNGQPSRLPDLFNMWLQELKIERGGRPFPIEDYLLAASDSNPTPAEDLEMVARADHIGPLEAAFRPIVDLAASVLRDGLTNPITVAQRGRVYVIETGERRWLTYHLLRWQAVDVDSAQDWAEIPARVVESVDLWRQATENTARADLNAIARARQLALLLMDLYGPQNFKPIDLFDSEQMYYAQVADGERYRVPRGTGEKILNATGLKNGAQIRQYRRLLRLPNPVWTLADDLNWTESFIQRELLNKAEDDSELIRWAIRLAEEEGYSVSILTVSPDLLVPEEPSKTTETSSNDAYTYWVSSGIPKLQRQLRAMSADERRDVIDMMRETLDAMQAELDDR